MSGPPAVLAPVRPRRQIRSAKGTFRFLPLPASVLGIIEAGGLIEYTKKKLEQEQE